MVGAAGRALDEVDFLAADVALDSNGLGKGLTGMEEDVVLTLVAFLGAAKGFFGAVETGF